MKYPDRSRALMAAGLALLLMTPAAMAKPIAYARGTTVMAEYGAGTMNELQVFYAPAYWWSGGVGALQLRSEDGRLRRDIEYIRGNLLLKRWNLPAAQANVFAWGGIGTAHGNTFAGTETAWNAGFQLDYETRRLYGSFKSDLQEANAYSHRIDTLQIGWAPYAHDYDTLATWVVLQNRHYTGDLFHGVETAVLLRLFKGGAWVEAGVTMQGKLQAMAMFNF